MRLTSSMVQRRAGLVAVLASVVPSVQRHALAQPAESEPQAESESSSTPPASAETQADASHTAPAGLLPIPDYSGDLLHRGFLTGDWGGARTRLAEKGVQAGMNWTQYLQGVASGGLANETRYGGTLDYELNFDLMRMGVLPGALVKMRAESRYGESVNTFSSTVLPANLDMLFPVTDEPDDLLAISLTTLSYVQMLSPEFGMFVGKMDTLDADLNEFASGRGTSQFMNFNFVFNPAAALRMPYSTLGAGFVWRPSEHVSLTSSMMNTGDSSTTMGFDDFGDGLTWSSELALQYALGRLPGGMNIGGLYSFNQEFAQLNTRLIFQPGEGLRIPTTDDTWAMWVSGWQYVWTEEKSAEWTPIHVNDGTPDREGLGLFWRVGFADEDTNPVDVSISGGIGGRGIIPSRDFDTFGVGYYYTSIQPEQITGLEPINDYSQGFEAFYNIAITPAIRLTLNAQVLESPFADVDTAVLLGVRLNMRF